MGIFFGSRVDVGLLQHPVTRCMIRDSRANTLSPEPGEVGCDQRPGLVFGGMFILLFMLTFLISGPWAGFHAVLFTGVGVLMLLRPARIPVPVLWWGLVAVFVIAASSAFLPARWFPEHPWRETLESLGVATGNQVVIQSRMAVEALAMFAITILVGFWLAGHRADGGQLRVWALVFTFGVATYALVSRGVQDSMHFASLPIGGGHLGFFPNRNHTATYLAMGALCGLGCTVQALRDKRFAILVLALAATAVCLWAVAAWSISRAGIILVVSGCVGWLVLVGPRYLGRHGLWAVALVALAAVGTFSLSESRVRDRFAETFDKAGAQIVASRDGSLTPGEKTKTEAFLDYRIPAFRDTLGMIKDFPLTGVGAGQFEYIFPQYRVGTTVENDKDSVHPESDWLWMAVETGVPATLALIILVIIAALTSIRGLRRGRERALRSACLVAAMMVPLHGLFDVPGHRITLAWSSILLYVMSLQPAVVVASAASARAWGDRLLAFILLALALLLARAEWFGGMQPAKVSAQHAMTRADKLYREDQALMQASEARGEAYQPDISDDQLEHALTLLDQALRIAPLDRDIRRHQAYYAFHFDDKSELIDEAFAVKRALDPTWVDGPLLQAAAWSALDPEKTMALGEEALRRARKLDEIIPESRWSEAQTREKIRHLARDQPELKDWIRSIDP